LHIDLLFLGKIMTQDIVGFKKMSEKNSSFTSAASLLDTYQSELMKQRSMMPNRIKFAIDDVIDLRKNKWVERVKKTGPKKMNEIRKQIETEKLQQQIELSEGLFSYLVCVSYNNCSSSRRFGFTWHLW
jgi:hypothetical protein